MRHPGCSIDNARGQTFAAVLVCALLPSWCLLHFGAGALQSFSHPSHRTAMSLQPFSSVPASDVPPSNALQSFLSHTGASQHPSSLVYRSDPAAILLSQNSACCCRAAGPLAACWQRSLHAAGGLAYAASSLACC